MKKTMVMILVIVIAILVWWSSRILSDYQTVQYVKAMTVYLEDYYTAHEIYPTKKEFHQKYPEKDDRGEYVYHYFPSPNLVKIQYPLRGSWFRFFALGDPITDPFYSGMFHLSSCQTLIETGDPGALKCHLNKGSK